MQLDIDEVIKALAHPVRRDILHWLKDPQAYFADQDHPLEIGVVRRQDRPAHRAVAINSLCASGHPASAPA